MACSVSSWLSRTWFSCKTRKACCWSCWLERQGGRGVSESIILTFCHSFTVLEDIPELFTHYWVWRYMGEPPLEKSIQKLLLQNHIQNFLLGGDLTKTFTTVLLVYIIVVIEWSLIQARVTEWWMVTLRKQVKIGSSFLCITWQLMQKADALTLPSLFFLPVLVAEPCHLCNIIMESLIFLAHLLYMST